MVKSVREQGEFWTWKLETLTGATQAELGTLNIESDDVCVWGLSLSGTSSTVNRWTAHRWTQKIRFSQKPMGGFLNLNEWTGICTGYQYQYHNKYEYKNLIKK